MRRVAVVLVLGLVVPAALLMLDVEVDNRLEKWQKRGGPDELSYRQFRESFGSDEFVMLACGGREIFEHEGLLAQLEAVEELERTAGIIRVQAIASMYRNLLDLEEPEVLAEELSSTPFYEELLISGDGATTAIVVSVEASHDSDGRKVVMSAVSEARHVLEHAGYSVAVVGSTALIDSLDRMSASESRRAFAVALACSMLALALLSRSVRAMIVAAACAGTTVVLSLGLVGLTGHGLNMITSVLPALLWVLGMSGIVHLMRRYRHYRREHDIDDAVRAAMRDTRRGITLAAVTTAVGFFSLLAADLEPVRELGIFAGAGLMISLAVNLVLGPELIRRLQVPAIVAPPKHLGTNRWLFLGIHKPRAVVVVSLVLVAAAAAAIPCIRVASNPLSFLPEDHQTTADYRTVASSLGGFYTLELMVELPVEWSDASTWPIIDRLAENLGRSEIVARVLSPLDLFRKLEHAYNGPDAEAYRLPASTANAEDMLKDLDDSALETLRTMVVENGRTIRLSTIVNEMDEHRFLGLVNEARVAVDRLPDGYSGAVTGQVLRLVEAQQTLVRTQLQSLGSALLVIFVVMVIGLRSLHLTLLSFVPNVLPLLAAFAMMAAAGFSLDAATVMVASVALGIAVDDTVHLLVALQEEQGSGPPREQVQRALERAGPALLLTSIAACIGFFALMTSSFVPIAAFGLLSGVAMVVALLADLWLVPGIVMWFLSRDQFHNVTGNPCRTGGP